MINRHISLLQNSGNVVLPNTAVTGTSTAVAPIVEIQLLLWYLVRDDIHATTTLPHLLRLRSPLPFHLPTHHCFNVSTLQCFNGSTLRCFDGSLFRISQRLKTSTSQHSTLRYVLQCFNASMLQCFDASISHLKVKHPEILETIKADIDAGRSYQVRSWHEEIRTFEEWTPEDGVEPGTELGVNFSMNLDLAIVSCQFA